MKVIVSLFVALALFVNEISASGQMMMMKRPKNAKGGSKSADHSSSSGSSNKGFHLYAPFENNFGSPPVPVTATLPFYSDIPMTDRIGTMALYCISMPPNDEMPGAFIMHCDITFGFHTPDVNLAKSDTLLNMSGFMIMSSFGGTDEGSDFLQLFGVSGGTGEYSGAKGMVTIDGSLGLQDYTVMLH